MAVAGISIIPQPERITGGIIIAGIIQTRGKGTGIIIIITVIALIIITGRHSIAGGAPIEPVIPALLVRIVGFDASRIFFKEVGSVACGKMPTVATLHKAHLITCWLLCAGHGVHLVYRGCLQRRRPLISGRLIPPLIMRVAS
jgi:hypothetical protein